MTKVTKALIPFIFSILSVFYIVFFGGYSFDDSPMKKTVLERMDPSFYHSIDSDSLKKWESESFQESNSYCIHLINYWNRTSLPVNYSSLHNCKPTDYFEAASLSKTMFALTSYRNAIPRIKDQNLKRLYLSLLQHGSGMENHTQCTFHYSDSGYLKAGELYQNITGKSFEKDITHEFPFKWDASFKGVDGYVRKDTLFRKIEKADTAYPNGSLYLNYKNTQLFSNLVTDWSTKLYVENQTDYRKYQSNHGLKSDGSPKNCAKSLRICGFKHLSWLEGIGLDESLGRPILFQWGCNWCYNHILLIDIERGQTLIILTNSIIGAHEIAQFSQKLYGQRLELFDYIGWW